jgi:DnaJ family protein A protein 2
MENILSKYMLMLIGVVGDVKVIHGQGMPSHRHHEPGDMYIRILVKFPESIDIASIHLLERALPARKPIEKFPKNVQLEDVHLEEPDVRTKEDAMREDAMDEDQGEPRVQCANQ